ncbi:TPA: hypothetical protein ACH3X2_013198 [Trebouxia sp. C0005]
MSPAKPAVVGRPQVPMGIHDLLEQSINRSRHYSGSNFASPASPRQVSKHSRQGHSNRAEQAPQGKDSRGVVHTTLQATLPEAALPKVSMSALEGNGGLSDAERTPVPERRKLGFSTGSKADKVTGGQSQSCAPAKGMIKKKVMRSPRVPSPLNRLHSTPVAALLLGSDRNDQLRSEQPASRAQEVRKEQQPAPLRPHTSPSRPLIRSGDGVRFRSEAVSLEVALQERLSRLDLELPPSAATHRQHGRLQLAQDTLATLCTSPMLATDGLLQFVQTEYNQALSGSMHEAQQVSTMSASVAKTNWINSGLRSQVRQLQSRLSDSNSLTARLQREMLLVKAKAAALVCCV